MIVIFNAGFSSVLIYFSLLFFFWKLLSCNIIQMFRYRIECNLRLNSPVVKFPFFISFQVLSFILYLFIDLINFVEVVEVVTSNSLFIITLVVFPWCDILGLDFFVLGLASSWRGLYWLGIAIGSYMGLSGPKQSTLVNATFF